MSRTLLQLPLVFSVVGCGIPAAIAADRPQTITNSIGMKLVLIPAGEFMMGSPDDEAGALAWEKPRHRVRITKPYYLGRTEVTKAQWFAVMGTPAGNRSSYSKNGENFPATHVTFDDVTAFLGKLSAKEGRTYRLPTEAEWEYACRAGAKTKYSFGDDESRLGEYAWFRDNAAAVGEEHTFAVGRKKPNAWGLYDMHGNVWEWCGDWYDETFYEQSPADDPIGPATGAAHSYRGGSWGSGPASCRAATRMWLEPDRRGYDLGLRVVLVPAE